MGLLSGSYMQVNPIAAETATKMFERMIFAYLVFRRNCSKWFLSGG